MTALQNLTLLGVGTTADATNPFSAKLNNALWAAKTVAEGGDGHLRYKLSKESAAKTLVVPVPGQFLRPRRKWASPATTTSVKVSADGATWTDALDGEAVRRYWVGRLDQSAVDLDVRPRGSLCPYHDFGDGRRRGRRLFFGGTVTVDSSSSTALGRPMAVKYTVGLVAGSDTRIFIGQQCAPANYLFTRAPSPTPRSGATLLLDNSALASRRWSIDLRNRPPESSVIGTIRARPTSRRAARPASRFVRRCSSKSSGRRLRRYCRGRRMWSTRSGEAVERWARSPRSRPATTKLQARRCSALRPVIAAEERQGRLSARRARWLTSTASSGRLAGRE